MEHQQDTPQPAPQPPREQSRGFLMVYTGEGKGKTTAALGMALRAVGYGKQVCFIQFVKGTWHASEIDGLAKLGPQVELIRTGEGFYQIVDDTKSPEVHRQAAANGIRIACEKLSGGEFFLVVLDELNVALSEGLVTAEEVETVLAAKRPETHLLLTGRGAPQWLQDRADLVTVMTEVKHPFQKGLFARKGIDY